MRNKLFLALILFLVPSPVWAVKPISNLGANNFSTQNTYGSTDPGQDNAVILWSGNTALNNYFCLAEQNGGGSCYQVPTGKKLIMTHCTVLSDQATSATIRIVYGDNGVGFNTATTPTNCANAIQGGSCGGGAQLITVTLGAVGEYLDMDCSGVTIPADKFPHLQMTTTNSNQIRWNGVLVDE